MNDKELADRIVALGVGEHCGDWYGIMAWDTALEAEILDPHDADRFVRDWRVAGALMEELSDSKGTIGLVDLFTAGPMYRLWGYHSSLPRAICEACVEALEAGK